MAVIDEKEKASTEAGFENMEKYYGSIPKDKIDPEVKAWAKKAATELTPFPLPEAIPQQ